MSKIKKSEKDSLSVIKIPVAGEVPLETLDVVLKVASIEATYSQDSMDKITSANDLLVDQLENELILAHLEIKRIAAVEKELNTKLDFANQELNDLSYTERIINTLRDPLIVMDKDLKVMRCTSGFYNKFNVTELDTEGHYFFDLGNQQWNIPELRYLLESILPEKKVVNDFEVTHVFPEIGRRVMCLNARQLDKVNGGQLILLDIEDITEKRKIEDGLSEIELLFQESKDRLQLAIDAAGLGTWDYNTLTGELITDSRCNEMFALLPLDEISYTIFIAMIHEDDRKHVDKVLQQALKGANNGEYEEEFRTVETVNKDLKWIKFKGKAYFNAENVAYRLVGTAVDITVQKILDQATKELLKKKDDFMSIASHELKTPITTLKAALQLLDRMKDNPNRMLPNLIVQANKSMEKVTTLIENLLNTNKLNEGQLHLNKTSFIIAKMIADCCQHVRIAGIYNIITEGDTALKIYADSDRIDQVIINFVNNAIKYSPGFKEIHIKVEKVNGVAKVSVTDNGPGIQPEKLPYLFDRYYRVDSSGMQYSGLGLGLYISAEIIKRHNGQIGVDSEMGKGSTFWFTLPLE
ncbi:sensor histidine kinase [Mucilaginibacter sp.]|uniref:PAS domain-containing sensor histidine kinase n=1 Tax=Mucilaginibacter sp. TaxID=1882438 RepID=UPI00261894FC|nr:sensor histidine kinase [Mucilaginibacter sp.]MDB4925655.1 chemotaxis protein CheR [Mucilaginibacter sp.]